MRALIIALLLFALTATGAYCATASATTHLTALCQNLHTMEEQIIDGHWSEAQNTFAAIRAHWEDHRQFWRLMLSHDALIDIEANLLRTGAYTQAEDYAQSMAELASLYAQYQQLLALEQVSIENIF